VRSAAWALLGTALFAASTDREAAIEYFAQVREVAVSAPDRQNYIVFDESVWTASRAGLADLRLYDGNGPVPYAMTEQRGGIAGTETAVRVLNAARHGDHTEFDLEIAGAAPYNRVRLTLDKKDFVATARVAGRDSARSATAAAWPSASTLFDFTTEGLGANSTIAMPTWTYRYVHVVLGAGIAPSQVHGAAVSHIEEKRADWTNAGACRVREERRHETVIACLVPAKVPVERIRFDVPPARVNFRRFVTVTSAGGREIAAGSISRIRIARGGTTVITEELAVATPGSHGDTLIVTVGNGDDPPLGITAIQAQMVERRLYFDPHGSHALKLYAGDAMLGAPVYDYAKFFDRDPRAPEARLGPVMDNPAFTGRGDERPWSERHKAVLWVAMLVAVAGLAALAIGGLKAAPPPAR
jgi:hypothetical protein